MGLVLRVLGPECGHRGGVLVAFVGLRFEQLCPAVDADPAQVRPVLVPAVGEDDRLREDQQIAHPARLVGIRRGLGFLVDRAVEPWAAEPVVRITHDVADRDEAWSPVWIKRGEGRESGLGQEAALVGGQDRLVGHGEIMHGSVVRGWRWVLLVALATATAAVGCGESRVIQNRAATLAELTGPYSYEPLAVDAVLASRLDGQCHERLAGARAPVLALLDARGLGTATLVYASADRFAIECRVRIHPGGNVSIERVFTTARDLAVVARAAVVPLTADARERADGTRTYFESGVVAGPVAQVVIVLGNGRQVRASVANGFYAASWPDDLAMTERQAYDASGASIPAGR